MSREVRKTKGGRTSRGAEGNSVPESREMASPVRKPVGTRNKGGREETTMDKFMAENDDIGKTGIERIITEIDGMRKIMRDDMEEWRRDMNEQMRKTIVQIKEEMLEERRIREDEFRKEREEWRQEKRIFEKRIGELEWTNEKRERAERKNKIVIRGIRWGKENLEKKVEKCIKEKLETEIEIRKVSKLTMKEGREIVIANIEK